MKTGRLEPIGQHKLGAFMVLPFHRCVDCGTEYPEYTATENDEEWRAMLGREPGIYCNGQRITACPFCAPK